MSRYSYRLLETFVPETGVWEGLVGAFQTSQLKNTGSMSVASLSRQSPVHRYVSTTVGILKGFISDIRPMTDVYVVDWGSAPGCMAGA